jgi:hypothetical protein
MINGFNVSWKIGCYIKCLLSLLFMGCQVRMLLCILHICLNYSNWNQFRWVVPLFLDVKKVYMLFFLFIIEILTITSKFNVYKVKKN